MYSPCIGIIEKPICILRHDVYKSFPQLSCKSPHARSKKVHLDLDGLVT